MYVDYTIVINSLWTNGMKLITIIAIITVITLPGVLCNNPDCVYLHELGDDDDRFTKEEIQAGQV